MLGRSRKAKAKAQVNTVKEKINIKEIAAIKLQCLVRKFLARRHLRFVAKEVWQRVYDPVYKKYFWFNHLDGKSYWTKPRYNELFEPADVKAALKIQCVVRSFIHRMRARKIAHQKYTRFYDAKVGKFYWMENSTQKTTWNVTPWLIKQAIPLPLEDQMLFEAMQKIRDLEAQLAEKNKEIKEVRKQTYEALEPQVIKDKLTSVQTRKRSKNMDEWKVEELAAFFTELKMEEYIPFIFQNRVDGNLFINLQESDWADMGIVNHFHIRKLNLVLKAFRVRFQRKKDKIEVEEEEDLVSEYTPSELSAVIAAEDAYDDAPSEESSFEEDSFDSDEDDYGDITEEQRQEKRLDEKNIQVDLMVRGDAVNFPMVGDIVRVRYTATLADTGKVVMSTKNVMDKPWVEFVLGIDQVIKGFDRALPQMSVGERSKITISPEYAYGKDGLSPHIPPHAALVFDLTLLGFRARSTWVKPLIQDSNTMEHPYHVDAKISSDLAAGKSSSVTQSGSAMMSFGNDNSMYGNDNDSFTTALGSRSVKVSGGSLLMGGGRR